MTRDFDLLWDFGKPAETEAKFRSLLPKQPDDFARWELLTQIARCQGLQGKFEEAHATLESVASEVSAKGDLESTALTRVKLRSLLERGRIFNSSRRKEEAKPLFLSAYRLACEIEEDFFAIDAAHMIAIVESPEQAMEWNLKGVAMAEASDDERAKGWLGSLHNNIGWTLHDEGKYEEALTRFQKALECRVKQQKREPILVARWCIARCLRSLGRIDEALQIQRDLLSARELESEPDMYVHQELAECLAAKGNAEQAEFHRAKFEELRDRSV